ncbi:alpha/beta fold hydrolase [Aquihabitans daechungensis]|uniref:alpha/beta fold hydrolase n=1 Tax=Aquihabitans daechungensis TaxID=1052257 RepID=UPI003BA0FA3D
MMSRVEWTAHDGVELAYERTGSGPRLLFLNGSGTTMAASPLLRAPFSKSFEVLTLDLRGIGESTIPDEPFTMAHCAADARAVMDHVGWDTCSVLGISFGGMVAQELAVTVPERIERLALLCTSAGGAGGSSYPLHDSPATETVLDTRFTPEWLAEHRRDATLVEFMAKRRDEAKSDEVRRGERAQLEARRHHDVWDRLDRITAPTFVAGGRFDGLAPFANSEAIASRIPDAELHGYEGGHAFFVQDPQAFPEVIAFLTGTTR